MNQIRILRDGSISNIDNRDAMACYSIYDIMTAFDEFVIAGINRFIVPYDGKSWTPGGF